MRERKRERERERESERERERESLSITIERAVTLEGIMSLFPKRRKNAK